MDFNPRSPCGERLKICEFIFFFFYFNPRSPCGERPNTGLTNKHDEDISIHALLAESDLKDAALDIWSYDISIHALLAESDGSGYSVLSASVLFQSTLSLRRATYCFSRKSSSLFYFNPRSPCGERHFGIFISDKADRISIHALLAESDPFCIVTTRGANKFQSTLSLRRATQKERLKD